MHLARLPELRPFRFAPPAEAASASRMGGAGRPAGAYGPAAPRRDRPAVIGWLRQEDYPEASLAARESGEVTAAFDVAETGAAENCRVTRSSGYLRLDDATCALIERRARFRPAADAAGRPVRSRDVRAFRWVLPPRGLNAAGVVADGGVTR